MEDIRKRVLASGIFKLNGQGQVLGLKVRPSQRSKEGPHYPIHSPDILIDELASTLQCYFCLPHYSKQANDASRRLQIKGEIKTRKEELEQSLKAIGAVAAKELPRFRRRIDKTEKRLIDEIRKPPEGDLSLFPVFQKINTYDSAEGRNRIAHLVVQSIKRHLAENGHKASDSKLRHYAAHLLISAGIHAGPVGKLNEALKKGFQKLKSAEFEHHPRLIG